MNPQQDYLSLVKQLEAARNTHGTRMDPQQHFLALLQQLALSAGNQVLLPPQPIGVQRELRFADPLLGFHTYWKSKIMQVHCYWDEVTGSIDVDKLDKRNLPKTFEDKKIPTFKLGRRVRIVSEDKRMFKIIHKKVGIWREGLAELVGKDAIIMNLSSRFAIGVALIENGNMANIHAFSLEVVENQTEEGFWQNKTGFRRDDEVAIHDDLGVLANLQRNSRKTPFGIASQLVRFIGRVMGVFRGEVIVTFDEIHHEMFNPAALKRYNDQAISNKKKFSKPPTDKDVRPGSKVKVKSNLFEVMAIQVGHGEWNYKMTKFVGKGGIVVDNIQGGDVIVKFSPFESYLMNRKALIFDQKKNRARNKSGGEINQQIPFAVGDIVRLNMDRDDLMCNLHLLRIPREFATIISDCMEFVGYVDQARGVVDMGDGVEFIVGLQLLTKVGSPMAEETRKQRQQNQEIGVGKEVVLFIGPKSFVNTCLDSNEYKAGFEKALDETAYVEGYDESGNAVIRYADGKLYKLPDEYLCSPRAIWKASVGKKIGFFFDWPKEPIELPWVATSLENTILHSVTEVLKRNGESEALGWTSTVRKVKGYENMKILEIKFPGCVNDFDKFIEILKSKLATEKLRATNNKNNELTIVADGFEYKMKFVGMEEGSEKSATFGTPEESGSTTKVSMQDSAPPTPTSLGRSLSVNEVLSEQGNPGVAAIPFGTNSVNIPVPQGVNQIVLQLGGNAQPPPARNTIPRAPTSDAAPPNGVIINPTGPANVNIYGTDGVNVNINRSYVRSIDASE